MRRLFAEWSAACYVVLVCAALSAMTGCPVPDGGSDAEPVEAASTVERVRAATRRLVLTWADAAADNADRIDSGDLKFTQDAADAFKAKKDAAIAVWKESVERAIEARAPSAKGVKSAVWRDVASGFRGAVR